MLFPIAFSDAVVAMAPSVSEMAERFRATVTVLHVVSLLPEYVHGPSLGNPCNSKERVRLVTAFSPALRELRAQQGRRLEAFSRTHSSDISHTERIEDGDPAAVIDWVAKCEETDLIMMPTSGLGRFRSLLLGSVSSKILYDTTCPVWASVHKPESVSALPLGYRSILCAVGMNPDEYMVLEAVSLFVQTYGARICLRHLQSISNEQDTEPVFQCLKQEFRLVCVAARNQIAPDVCVRIL
jgi:nucleotide-binding universal stress UspA family protein